MPPLGGQVRSNLAHPFGGTESSALIGPLPQAGAARPWCAGRGSCGGWRGFTASTAPYDHSGAVWHVLQILVPGLGGAPGSVFLGVRFGHQRSMSLDPEAQAPPALLALHPSWLAPDPGMTGTGVREHRSAISAPKNEVPTYIDAEAMTPEERLERLVDILSRGVLRQLEHQRPGSPEAPSSVGGDVPTVLRDKAEVR